MTDTYREKIGIAIDGGGVKGAIVAHGIMALEQQLGVRALIDSPRVQVLAGTSTGALIAALLAAGFTGQQILELYESLSATIFSKAGKLRPGGATLPLISSLQVPIGVQRLIYKIPLIGGVLGYVLFPARYSLDPLRDAIRQKLRQNPIPNDNPTLREVGEYLDTQRNGATIIITATEVSARKTHFLKTTPSERFQDMPLVDALLASSSIPTYWDPIPFEDYTANYTRRLVDGGVGIFGNPAYVVAWEMCDPRNEDPQRGYDPANTTVISFGTGTYTPPTYRSIYGDPQKWWALVWAARLPDVFGDMAIREQSRNIIATYQGIDLRRFQVALEREVDADDFGELDGIIKQKGLEMQQLIRYNRHALHPDPDFRNDPEGIWHESIAPMIRNGE